MKKLPFYLFIIIFILIAKYNYAEDNFFLKDNYCELITYEMINFHFIKCRLKKILLDEEINEIYFNKNLSLIFLHYLDHDNNFYVLGLLKKIDLKIGLKFNYFEVEYKDYNINYKMYAKFDDKMDLNEKIIEIKNDIKKYYYDKISNESLYDKVKRYSENSLNSILENIKKERDGVFFYNLIVVSETIKNHCIDIYKNKPKCFSKKL